MELTIEHRTHILLTQLPSLRALNFTPPQTNPHEEANVKKAPALLSNLLIQYKRIENNVMRSEVKGIQYS